MPPVAARSRARKPAPCACACTHTHPHQPNNALQLDAKGLRAELAPITSAALERIKLLLLNMARQATLAVLEDLNGRIQQLAGRPTQLDEFVGYMVRCCVRLCWLVEGANSRLQ